ncbi:MAG TPA: hypothetical protein VK607_26670 [Kofleriaceae bacterium]|nr:hypothetical protein [Kofleriaceae bacterium]
MPTSNSNENSSSNNNSAKHVSIPDGKSSLPSVLPDFPTPGQTDPIPPAAAKTETK